MADSVRQKLLQNKINSGGIAAFGASIQTLVPQTSPCMNRQAVDQYGRPAPAASIDTLTCAGVFSPMPIIMNENSLRSFLSPQYYNIGQGLAGTVDNLYASANDSMDLSAQVASAYSNSKLPNVGNSNAAVLVNQMANSAEYGPYVGVQNYQSGFQGMY
jgi:hypothetical protein